MRRYLLSISTLALAFCGLAGAQGYGRYGPYPYDGGRDAYGRPYGDRGPRGYSSGRDVIGRVMADLDRVGAYGRHDRHNRERVDHARRELMKFQSKWARGRFDSHPLDKAIDHMKDLVDSDRIAHRDQRELARDIDALREFRATRGYYGGWDRRYADGYRD